MVWLVALVVSLMPIVTTRRVVRGLDAMPDEQLPSVRQLATSRVSVWFILAWSVLLVALGAVAAIHGKKVAALVCVVLAAALVVASRALQRAQAAVLDALGDRGHIARTERYRRRDRLSGVWASLILAGWFVSNLATIVIGDRRDALSGARAASSTLVLVGAAGWLAVRTRMYLAGDDLDTPEPPREDVVRPVSETPRRDAGSQDQDGPAEGGPSRCV